MDLARDGRWSIGRYTVACLSLCSLRSRSLVDLGVILVFAFLSALLDCLLCARRLVTGGKKRCSISPVLCSKRFYLFEMAD